MRVIKQAASPVGEWTANVVGIDPHKRTLTATVVDARGAIVASEHFRVSGDGHRALAAWARSFGPIARWGIEGAAGWGRHTAVFLAGREQDVRDVCATRTARSDRACQRGKSDTLDSERIARETLAHPLLPRAFKRAGDERGPDEQRELLALWHNARRSILTSRQHLLNEAESLLSALPLALREQLPDSTAVRPRLAALAGRNRRRRHDAPTTLRLRLLDAHHARIGQLDREETAAVKALEALVRVSASTLGDLCGLSTRSVAELLVEVGDPRRFTEGGFARFNASAPLAASTAEGPGEPVRHRFNPGGNRRVNAVLHRMAVTQLRCEPRAKVIYENARARGHTKREARPILKRHLSDVIYRRMMRDLKTASPRPLPDRQHAPARDAVKVQRPTGRTTLTAPRAGATLAIRRGT
ncbi:MAG: transposase [Solirubrobacteraceae bacterium]|nr:transposase [Solirubrobacteraceae bacterium]